MRRRRSWRSSSGSGSSVIPLRDNVPTRTFPFVTLGLIVVNALVYLWENSGRGLEQHVFAWGFYPCEVQGPCTNLFAAHHHALRAGRRPFFVGLVHGLAGSAGLMLVVLATIPSPALAVAYLVVFGLGSIGGMVAMSALLGLPLLLASERLVRGEVVVQRAAAIGSIVVGVLIAWEMGAGLLPS